MLVQNSGSTCRSTYDRGALIEAVLANYAPDVVLTHKDVLDPEVRRRFLARERRLGQNRKATDRKFARVAGCFVLLEPERASRLVLSDPGSDEESQLRGQIINRGKPCVNNAKRVIVDPAQFRVYIAGAVYGWIAAVRNVDSLVPEAG
ncbi:hypothetical protein [Sphingomonas japonica]|uniref:Transposase n=1 Tax=Sphingomonas japonica TaxID=511662 RepID=A0ABX0U212_9SPHN|nr:hypothetical protein [Sphingomonas japonica]NIJ23749.1 hypothetical protein [Sphingomonas japonica]